MAPHRNWTCHLAQKSGSFPSSLQWRDMPFRAVRLQTIGRSFWKFGRALPPSGLYILSRWAYFQVCFRHTLQLWPLSSLQPVCWLLCDLHIRSATSLYSNEGVTSASHGKNYDIVYKQTCWEMCGISAFLCLRDVMVLDILFMQLSMWAIHVDQVRPHFAIGTCIVPKAMLRFSVPHARWQSLILIGVVHKLHTHQNLLNAVWDLPFGVISIFIYLLRLGLRIF